MHPLSANYTIYLRIIQLRIRIIQIKFNLNNINDKLNATLILLDYILEQ